MNYEVSEVGIMYPEMTPCEVAYKFFSIFFSINYYYFLLLNDEMQSGIPFLLF